MGSANPKRDPEYDAGHVPMTEELDDARHTMPSVAPVAIALVLVAVAIGVAAYVFRAKPVVSGKIDNAYAVTVPRQNTVLAAVNVTFKNVHDKPITLRSVSVTLNSDDGEHTDDGASVADFPRYVQAYPELAQYVTQGIARETRLAPGQELSGTVIVSFPVTKEKFDARRDLSANLSVFDHRPVEIR